MNLDTVTIRPMQPDEITAVAMMRAAGFGGNPEQIARRIIESPRYDISNVLVAENQGMLIGTATVFPAKMWLSGVPMDIGAVAGVTVLSAFRGQGIGSKLMRALVVNMYASGRALSVLFPFSHRYYKQFEYGTVGDLHMYRIAPDNINVSGDAAGVRPFTPADLPMLRVVYKGQMTWHNGWFTRSNEWWDQIVKRWPDIMVYEKDDFIDGYYIYATSTDAEGNKTLHIKEFFAAEPEALQGLLASLAALGDVQVIEYLAPADSLLRHSLYEPKAVDAHNRSWIFDDLCYVTPGPMARIINLPKAFTTRFYTRGMSGELVFKVRDPLIPLNEEPITFRLVDGRAETRAAGDSPIQVETDIATLTQVLTGYLKAVDAYRLGRIAAEEDTCTWLDKIIVDTPLFIQAGDWF
jgi:predicted acetyltransferase